MEDKLHNIHGEPIKPSKGQKYDVGAASYQGGGGVYYATAPGAAPHSEETVLIAGDIDIVQLRQRMVRSGCKEGWLMSCFLAFATWSLDSCLLAFCFPCIFPCVKYPTADENMASCFGITVTSSYLELKWLFLPKQVRSVRVPLEQVEDVKLLDDTTLEFHCGRPFDYRADRKPRTVDAGGFFSGVVHTSLKADFSSVTGKGQYRSAKTGRWVRPIKMFEVRNAHDVAEVLRDQLRR